ncbi:Transglutaminase-like superfamily protein [compost metagenome]
MEELEAARYRFESPYVNLKQNFVAWADDCFVPGRPLLLAVQALMAKIFSEFTYDAAATQVATPLAQVLEEKRGVCQDLLTQPPAGKPRLIGADASHAWIAVWCPQLGWVDFDPTNNLIPALEHITLAWGRDFGDVSPLRGVILGGGSHDPEVSVTVMPLEEALARGV